MGMEMLVSPLQPENASSPMEVMLLGMVMLVSPLQPENACEPMEVTAEYLYFEGIITSEVLPVYPVTA